MFAVMAYVISHMQPNREREEYVTLNAVVLAATLGEKVETVQEAIRYLCAPDGSTTTPGEEGRRLVEKTPFVYWVVNGKHYREMMDEEDQRAKAAARQERHREKVLAGQVRKGPKRSQGSAKNAGLPLPGETAYVAAVERGEKPVDPGSQGERQVAERKGSWGEVVGVRGNGV